MGWVKVRCSVRCMERIGFRLELESISDMRARVRLRFRFMVRPG